MFHSISLKLNTMPKQKKKRPKRYSLEEVVRAVNHWSMTTVPEENVKQFVNKEQKIDNQLSFFNH